MPESPAKICFVAPNAYPLLADDRTISVIGGAELQQVIVATALRRRGYSVSMVCLNFGQPDGVQVDGITVHRAFRQTDGLPVLRFVWPRLSSIWQCLKKADADIYYYRTAGMLAGVVAAFCRRYNRRSVFAAAGNPDLERNTSKIRFARDRRIYEYGLRNVDLILVQNEEQARLCRDNYGRDPVCIPNIYLPAASDGNSDGRNILWVSTIREIKRPELFLDVASALPEYKFQIVGGPDKTESALYSKIKARALTLDNVDFVGFAPFSEIGKYFDAAAVFVNTSESEGFPNTFLQSWTRAIPTVSFVDSGARMNRIPLGRIVKTTDQMIAAVTELMEDDAKRREMGTLCKNYVESAHSAYRILELYDEVFSGLLQKDVTRRAQPGDESEKVAKGDAR